ncbi:hypothetical protein BaRGS_00009066, partial [Batillaria attramentaria]
FRRSGEHETEPPHKPCLPHRYKLAIFAAVGVLIVVGSRTCFALVMTHVTSGLNGSYVVDDVIFSECTAYNESHDVHVTMGGDTMFLLHTAYSAGLTVAKVPGSVLATCISPIRVTGVSVLVTCLVTLTLPHVITFSTPLLFVVRTLQGVIEAVQQPATIGIISAWATDTDNTRLSSIFMTGACGVMWCVIWLMNFYDTPDLHPSLALSEREHHRTHGTAVRNSCKKLRSIPWKSILRCPSVWAVFLGSFTRNLIFSLMVFAQPQYFRDAFNLKTSDIGLMSTLPYVGLGVMCAMGGVVSDRLLRHGMSKTRTRKFAYTVGHGVEALSLVGYIPIATDVAPQYAGVICGLAMLGSVGAVFSTLLASFLTGVSRTLADWQQLFLITGVVHIVDVIIFDIIAKAELQPWAGGAGSDEGSLVAQASSSLDAYEETSLLGDETKPTYYGAVTTERGHTPGKLQIEGF